MALEIVRRESLADGRVVCYRFDSLGAEAAEEWFNDVRDLYLDWKPDQPFLMLLDLRKSYTNLLSSDAMSMGHEISEIDREGKTAFLIDKSKPATNVLLQFIERALHPTRPREIFESEQEAVDWLLSS